MKRGFAFFILLYLANLILASIIFYFVNGFTYFDFFLGSFVYLLFFSVLYYYLSLVNKDRKNAHNHYEYYE